MNPFLHSLKLAPRPVWPNKDKMSAQAICVAVILICPFASAQWMQTSGPDSDYVSCLAVDGTKLLAGTWWGGVLLSTNSGTSWNHVNNGLTDTVVNALAISGTNLFAGTNGGGVYLSTNSGGVWTQVNTGLMNTNVQALALSGTTLLAGTAWGIFLSTNNGANWRRVFPNTYIDAFAVSDTNLFAGGWGSGVNLSTDGGANWHGVNVGLTNIDVWTLAVSGTNLFAGTSGGVCLSTNSGTNWAQSGLATTRVEALALSGTNLFAGTWGGGVYLSTNSGEVWTQVSTGLTDTVVRALAISGTSLFAGGWGSGVWRRPLSEMTSVREAMSPLPAMFSLSQNSPNPFNPTTVVRYQLPVASNVRLVVYDIIGRDVAVLVNERKAPGTYEVTFNGSDLASGTYFYRLQAGDYVATKKLLIVK